MASLSKALFIAIIRVSSARTGFNEIKQGFRLLPKIDIKARSWLSESSMDDVYQHAKRQIHQPATPELVTGFKEKMQFIRSRFKHNARTVDSCLSGMGNPPTLLEVLTAAFVVNGGVLFKHGARPEEEEGATDNELELNELMQEIQELSKPGSPPGSSGGDAISSSNSGTGAPRG